MIDVQASVGVGGVYVQWDNRAVYAVSLLPL